MNTTWLDDIIRCPETLKPLNHTGGSYESVGNLGFAKPHPVVPESVYNVVENEVYDILAYLVVDRKR